MTDVIRIFSEAEFIEGSRTPTSDIQTPLQNARKTATSIDLTAEAPTSILDYNYHQPDTSKDSPELEVLYFKPSHGHLSEHKPQTRRNVDRIPGYVVSDPYDELISASLLLLKHLDYIRSCISKVKHILEEPCPGCEEDFPPVTTLRAWKFVVEYGIHCLGKPRPSEDMSRKIVKRHLKKSLAFTVAEVDRGLALAHELIKNLNTVEKQVYVIQTLAARIFKQNLKSAEASKSATAHAPDHLTTENSPIQSPSPAQSTILPKNFITRRNLWIQSGIDGISLKTGSRKFWIKLLTVSLTHKLNFLSIFLAQLSKFGKESEALLKSAQNLLINPEISEPSELNNIFNKIKSSTEISSVQTLVQHIPALLKSKKKKFTPKEQVMGLRVCWRLSEDFAKAKAELSAVTETMTVYRDEVKGLYKNRNLVLKGNVIYFEASEKFQLLIGNIGDSLELGKLFDAYSTYGISDAEDDHDSESLTRFEHNLEVDSEMSTFTVIDSTRTLNGRIVIPETMANSELNVSLESIKLEYEAAFHHVKSSGDITDPEILLCSDTVKLFLDNCTRLITTLATHTERLRTSLTSLESDSYKQFPGVLVWTQLVIKMLLITNFSSTMKESLAKDMISLFEIQEHTEASIVQHENALHKFHEYVLQVIRELRDRDTDFAKICDEVIENDHFSNMLAFTEQKLILPNINSERDEFSIRISFINNQCKIFSIPASGSTERTRIVKFSILDKRTTASLLMETMDFIGTLLTSTIRLLNTGIRVLAKHGIARTLKSTEIKNLPKLQPFEKLAILIALKAVLSSLAQTFVLFRELKLITQQLNFVFEAFTLLLQFEDFPIPSTHHTDVTNVPEAIPSELKAQFLSFSIYHYIPSENHAFLKLVEMFHAQHGMTLTEVVRHENKIWRFGRELQQSLPIEETKIVEYKGLTRPDPPLQIESVADETPKPPEKLYRKIPLGLFVQEMPRIIDSVLVDSKKIPKPPITPIQIDNKMTSFFNVFTTWLQSKIFKSVQSLHLPKASIYIEKVSETRPIVGQLEALCFFIGLASTQLNSKSLPVESRVYNKLRPKFLEFTNALVAFQNTRKDIYAWIWKRVDSLLSTLEYENKEKLEQIHGEEIPGLDELHRLCPIPPPDLATSIWNTGMAIKSVQKEIPEDKLMTFHWNVWRHDILEVEYKTHTDVFEYSGMTFRTRGKLLDQMMDQALSVLNKSLTFLKESKFDITEAGRVMIKLKDYLQELDMGCHIRPEQTYVILRTLRARIVGVYLYLDRTESILKRCRFFLSHGIRHIRAHLHEVDSFNRDFGDNPFHYLSLRVELELLQPMNIVRHHDHDTPEVEIISQAPVIEQETGPIGDQIQGQDHSRTMLKFFESFGNEVHRLGTLLVSGLQITHSCLSSPSACADQTTEPSVPKIVGLGILIGQVMIEIRTYNELLAKEHNFMSLVQEVETCAEQFPIRSSKIFGKTPKVKLMEAIESTEETITKIAGYLKAPFNMAGGLEPNVTVRENTDLKLLELSNTDLTEGSEAQVWTLSVTDSTSKLMLRHEATGEQVKFGDLNTMKQVGILKLLFQTLKEALLTGSKTLETTGIDSVKDAGSRLKLIKSSLKTFLKTNPPNADEFFDLTTILDDLHFSVELVKGTWSQMNLEIKTVSKILTCASAYMRLRFTTAGIKSTATYLHSANKHSHPHKRAGAAAMTFKEGQIQKRYTSKVCEVEEHLKSFIVAPLAIPLKLHLTTHAPKK